MDAIEKSLCLTNKLWEKRKVDLEKGENTESQVFNFWQNYTTNLHTLLTWLDNAEEAIAKDEYKPVNYVSFSYINSLKLIIK